MNLTERSLLCDSLEVACMQMKISLSPTDFIKEIVPGSIIPDGFESKVQGAFALANERYRMCPQGYSFEVTDRSIKLKDRALEIDPYAFLLIGSVIKDISGFSSKTVYDFRKYFEDIVNWALSQEHMMAHVLGTPRRERGLSRSLKKALREIGKNSFESSKLRKGKVTSDDNDLGVDVVVTDHLADSVRIGRPIYLIQCATGKIEDLHSKLTDRPSVFNDIWSQSFHIGTTIRCVATPYDLINFDPTHWSRLCADGWVLDRLRIVRLFQSKTGEPKNLSKIIKLSKKMSKAVEAIDWRSGWRE